MMLDETRQATHHPASDCLVLRAPSASAPLPLCYRQAPFLAHLIATQQQFPQTRARRRAEPAQAILAYRATAERAKWG
jgi:hypothetical protein